MSCFRRPGEAGFPRGAGPSRIRATSRCPGRMASSTSRGSTSVSLILLPRTSRIVPSSRTSPQARNRLRSSRAATHVGPAEVEAVRIVPHGDRHLPVRRRRITGHRIGRPPRFARYGQRGLRSLLLLASPICKLRYCPPSSEGKMSSGQAGALDHHGGERPELRRCAAGRDGAAGAVPRSRCRRAAANRGLRRRRPRAGSGRSARWPRRDPARRAGGLSAGRSKSAPAAGRGRPGSWLSPGSRRRYGGA